MALGRERDGALAVVLAAVVGIGLARVPTGRATSRLPCEPGIVAVQEAGQAPRVLCGPAPAEGAAESVGAETTARIRPGDGAATPRLIERTRAGTFSRPMPLGLRRTLGLQVDLNVLTEEDFESLPGIGPALARRIVETRRKLGGFASVEEMGQVRGIGPVKLAALQLLLVSSRR